MCHNSTDEGIADQVIPQGHVPLRSTHRIKLGGRQWLFDDQRHVDATVSDARSNSLRDIHGLHATWFRDVLSAVASPNSKQNPSTK
jgi:hypothetical protein